MSNFGDIQQGDSVNAFFSTSDQAGAAATITSGSVVIYKDGTTSNSTSGATLTVDVNSLTGFHRVTITTSSDASFYSVGSTFSVVVAGTVDSQSVRAVVGTFSVQARTGAGGRVTSQNLGLIEQGQATTVAIGPLLDPTSGEPVTSLTPGDITARLIKDTTSSTLTLTASGGNNDFTHIANGIWSLELTSANTNHMGQFSISLVDANVFVPVLASGVAMRTQAYESLVLDSDTLNVDVTQVGNSNVTSSSGVLEVNTKQINGDASAAAALDAAIDNSNNVVAVNVTRIDNSTTSATNLSNYTDGTSNQPVDTVKISGDSTAADRLEAMMDACPIGTVDNTAFTPTTTAFETNISEATADHFNDRVCLFVTGNLAGQQKAVTDYVLSSGRGKFTVNALTEAPANGDTFILV